MSNKKQLNKKHYWLVWKLIESLRARQIPFEGKDGEFAKDFDEIRDLCLDRAYDFNPKEN